MIVSKKLKVITKPCRSIFPTWMVFGCYMLITMLPVDLIGQQAEDALYIKRIHQEILREGQCYKWLTHLSEEIGGRLAGSPASVEAIGYTQKMMDTLGLDRVWVQPCKIPNYWTRGDAEKVIVQIEDKEIPLKCTALGGSPGTPKEGIQAAVIEVMSLEEVELLGEDHIKGKIVFYNRPMDPGLTTTFRAYGGAVGQRVNGPALASKYGAVGAIVRSMTNNLDDVPHTGVTAFREGVKPIPAIAISTNDAEKLSKLLDEHDLNIYMWNNSQNLGEMMSFNVIGEIKGSEFPDEIILVGGHLDAWDTGGGAHDDGAGCVQSMEVLYRLKKMGYRPKRTLRCVMFMNEENGLGGGRAYADSSRAKGEFHMAALESDSGGFTPRGFGCTGHADTFGKNLRAIQQWSTLLEPYDLFIKKGGAGADINPLKFQKGLLIGLRTDSQRYFDFHHTANDRIEAVNERELKMGAAAMTSLVYLLDQYGLSHETSITK